MFVVIEYINVLYKLNKKKVVAVHKDHITLVLVLIRVFVFIYG